MSSYNEAKSTIPTVVPEFMRVYAQPTEENWNNVAGKQLLEVFQLRMCPLWNFLMSRMLLVALNLKMIHLKGAEA